MTTRTKRAIKNYGEENCRRAYAMNRIDGEGARTIGFYLGLTTRQADAAIDAGAELIAATPADWLAAKTN